MQDANFVKILLRVNELLPLIRLLKSCFNLVVDVQDANFVKIPQELLSYCPSFDLKMLVLTTPTVSVRFTFYLAEVFIRS